MCCLVLSVFRNRTSTVVIKDSGGFRNEAHPVNKGWFHSVTHYCDKNIFKKCLSGVKLRFPSEHKHTFKLFLIQTCSCSVRNPPYSRVRNENPKLKVSALVCVSLSRKHGLRFLKEFISYRVRN